VSILLVGDRAMRTLNRTWRGKDQTTDVLSFPFRDCGTSRLPKKSAAGAPPELLGDIVVSLPVARRQAKEAGHGLACELDQLLVHGLVHLLGYDHEKGAGEARRMRRKEQLLLNRLS
jgi:probable rRNA maturation factor